MILAIMKNCIHVKNKCYDKLIKNAKVGIAVFWGIKEFSEISQFLRFLGQA